MEYAFLVTAIIGFMEFVKASKARDFETASIIFGSAVIGAVAGYFKVDGLADIFTGIQAGLSASGAYRIGRVVSGK